MENGNLLAIRTNPKPIDIVFENVSYKVTLGTFKKETKTILKGLSGHFKSGELTAIMGPSGAGKSSLLNILTGFHKEGVKGVIRSTSQPTGKTKVNGLCLKDSCYILQDDQLCPLFTVNETMRNAADLKLGSSMSNKAKEMLIEDILDSIGLLKTKDTRCARLSGGQKKRLSIALELIDNPPVMFLDEPTTGLDSSSCSQSIKILRSLAKGGRTIVCTIHQPSASVFEMFDHVYIVTDGLCVYQGSCCNVIPYLQSIGLHCPQYHNPADYILEIVSGEYGHFTSELINAANDPCWRGSSIQKTSPLAIFDDVTTRNHKQTNGVTVPVCQSFVTNPSEFERFWILARCSVLKLFRDWTMSHLKIVMHAIVGAFIGALYCNCGTNANMSVYNAGFLIVSLVYLSYTSLMPAILKFPSELHIIRKEQFNNWYKLKTFYAAFLLVNVPIQMSFSFVYCSFAYYLSSQLLDWFRFVRFVGIGMLVTVLSEGFGLCLGTTLETVNGLFIGSVAFCFFILFAGYVALFSHMPSALLALSYLSYFRYAFEGLVVTIYGYGRGPLECPPPQVYCHYRYPQRIFEELSMHEENFWSDIRMLMLFVAVFFFFGYIGLRRRVRTT